MFHGVIQKSNIDAVFLRHGVYCILNRCKGDYGTQFQI